MDEKETADVSTRCNRIVIKILFNYLFFIFNIKQNKSIIKTSDNTPGKYRNPIIISKLKRQNIKKIVERETTSINCRQQYNNVVLRLSLKFNNNNKKNKTVPKTNVIDPTNNSTENKSPNDIL